MVTRGSSREPALYAHWDIRVCRGVERFSDYKKVKARIRRALNTNLSANVPQGRKPHWRSLLSDKGLATITAIGTVALVLLGVLTVMVMLLLHA